MATGRLATFSLPFVDCELPQDLDSTIAEDGTPQPSCQSILIASLPSVILTDKRIVPYWKARFGAECVSAVVQGTLTSRAPKYSIILDLDRKVRDMELPLYTQQSQSLVAIAEAAVPAKANNGNASSGGAGAEAGLKLGETMSTFMPINYRELSKFSFCHENRCIKHVWCFFYL